jgi:hypothetical protein
MSYAGRIQAWRIYHLLQLKPNLSDSLALDAKVFRQIHRLKSSISDGVTKLPPSRCDLRPRAFPVLCTLGKTLGLAS